MRASNLSFKKRLFALALLLTLIFLAGAWWFFSYEKKTIQRKNYAELQGYVNLKADQISQWYYERISEARYFSRLKEITTPTSSFVEGLTEEIPESELRNSLSHIVETHSYFNILILSRQGELLFSYREGDPTLEEPTLGAVQQPLMTDSIQLIDFYRSSDLDALLMEIMAPMINTQGEVYAYMIFRIRPDDFLFPLLQRWPSISKTAETIMVKVVGDSLEYISGFRNRPDFPALTKIPLANEGLVAVKAVNTPEGVISGRDYQGKKVIAKAAQPEILPWVIYSKINHSEVFSDLYFRGIMIAGFTLIIILLFWTLLAWIYAGYQKSLFKKMYIKEREILQTEQEFKIALFSIGDAVIVTDIEGCIKKMNYMAEQISQWQENEAQGKPFNNIVRLQSAESGMEIKDPEEVFLKQDQHTSLWRNINLKNKHGKIIPVKVSFSKIKDDKGELIGIVSVIHDQTKERESEKRLKESEEKYRNLVEVSTEAILIEQEGRIIYLNPAAKRLLGASDESEILNRSSLDFFLPEYHPILKEKIRLIKSTGLPVSRTEYKISRLDGSTAIVEAGAVPFEFGKKKVIQLVLSDITERKNAEGALKKSEERYRKLFETMIQGVLYLDKEAKVISANPASAKILDIPLEEMAGRPSWDPEWKVFKEDGSEYSLEEYPAKIAFQTGESVLDAVMGLQKPSWENISWLKVNAHPVFEPGQEQPSGVFITMTDITRQRRNETALKQSRERYKMLFEANPQPMWVFEEDSLRFLDVNSAAISKYGYSREEFLNMSLRDILTKEEVPRLVESIEGANKGFLFPSEWYHKLKDGTPISVETSSKSLTYRGEKARLVSVNDITEKKQNLKLREDILLARQAAYLKQKFLANMSHEIRTPLTGIIGMTDLLRETASSEQQADYVDTIKASSEHLMAVVNNILNFSKLEAGKMNVTPRYFSFSTLMKKSHKLFDSLPKKDVEFNIETDNEIPDDLYADEQKVFQILTNLLGNALKFTEKGSITLKAQLQEKLKKNTILIKIEIIDTGIGIKPENQKKLFEFFTQAENTDMASYEGTGLGLAISREFANLLGGDVGLRSVPGKGSTFWFSFIADVMEVAKPAETQTVTLTEENHPLCILLVEDNMVIRKVITLILEEMGHEVTQAENGLEALDAYKPDKFDLVLMDIQMPVLDGISAVKKLREIHTDLPPIVGLSAKAFESDAKLYIEQGMDDYITKPVKASDFRKLINKWFKTS